MITVTYKCDETGQEMDITITLPENVEDGCKVTANFNPEMKDSSEDPYLLATRIFNVCTGND